MVVGEDDLVALVAYLGANDPGTPPVGARIHPRELNRAAEVPGSPARLSTPVLHVTTCPAGQTVPAGGTPCTVSLTRCAQTSAALRCQR
jgi:hypothetical protein